MACFTAAAPRFTVSATLAQSSRSSMASPAVSQCFNLVKRLPWASFSLLSAGTDRKFRGSAIRCALSPELKSSLDKAVRSHKVVLFMKGTKEFPKCGFSKTVVEILNSLNASFETLNILESEGLRQALKEYSNWPTFPQLYIDGEFFGGCDITVDAYKSGQLQELLFKGMNS